MAKSSLEKLIEKQIKQNKDTERKREREARKEAVRLRAASIVNNQPYVNGFRSMDVTAEEILKCLLTCKPAESNHIAFEDSIFPDYVQMSIGTELEKLIQYGMIGGLISYDNGGFCDILPPALVYFENKEKAFLQYGEENSMNINKRELNELIKQGLIFQEQSSNITTEDCAKWTQDVRTYNERILKKHPVYQSLKDALFFNKLTTILGCLQSVYEDTVFWFERSSDITMLPTNIGKSSALYDVFISHANADKMDYVNELKASLDKLNINVFYDKDSLEWGDNWKNRIYEGVAKAEFAIIIISENFFDREWTEKELREFLSRQNINGQKIILPILHNITIEQLQQKYPDIADIQALNSSKYSCDEIALKFAAQLIKRLKA